MEPLRLLSRPEPVVKPLLLEAVASRLMLNAKTSERHRRSVIDDSPAGNGRTAQIKGEQQTVRVHKAIVHSLLVRAGVARAVESGNGKSTGTGRAEAAGN